MRILAQPALGIGDADQAEQFDRVKWDDSEYGLRATAPGSRP